MSKWSLSKKIWAIIAILSAAFVISSVFSVVGLLETRDSLRNITQGLMVREQLVGEIKDNQRRIYIFAMESVLRNDEASLKKATNNFNLVVEKQEKDIKTFADIASKEEKALFEKYLSAYRPFLEANRQAQTLGVQHKSDEAEKVLFSIDVEVQALRSAIEEMDKTVGAELDAVSAHANESALRAIIVSSVLSTVSIVLSLLVAFFTLRAVTHAICEIVRNLSDSSVQVSGAATQIASSAEELSRATTEQAASLEETAASVEELNSMIARNSENARSAEETSGRSQDVVRQGQEVIKKMMQSMEAINSSSEGMAETVKVIEQIDKKTKVINEIVNKTELLSFNASVEAARAGEHGKGFAVVAEEVGNLARMSGVAAEEIAVLLEESIKKVNQMVQDTKKNVDIGAQVTRECGEVFDEVVKNVASVSGMATEISSASQEQTRGCGEITKAMTALDQMTQQNAATSEECAASSEELSAQAEALKSAVAHLVLTVDGEDGRRMTAFESPQAASQMANVTRPVQQKPAQVRASHTVVQMKGPRRPHSTANSHEPPRKKASGDAPDYDSDGFKDV